MMPRNGGEVTVITPFHSQSGMYSRGAWSETDTRFLLDLVVPLDL